MAILCLFTMIMMMRDNYVYDDYIIMELLGSYYKLLMEVIWYPFI